MGKFKHKIKPTEAGLAAADEQKREKENVRKEEIVRAEQAERSIARGKKIASAVFLAAAAALFLLSAVFFGLNVARMRNYESNYVRAEGTVVGFYLHGTGRRGARYSRILSYRFGEKEYELREGNGFYGVQETELGNTAEIYLNPLAPEDAVLLSEADNMSHFGAILFAFSAVTFSIGICFVKSGRDKSLKRFLWGYLPVMLLGTAFLLLFGLGLPEGGIAQVFARFSGALWYTAVTGIAAAVAATDAALSLFMKKRFP